MLDTGPDESYNWWEPGLPKAKVWERANAVYNRLLLDDKPRRAAYNDFLRLYGNLAYINRAKDAYIRPGAGDRVTFNVIAKWCDFATSRIGKQKPMPVVLPRGGNDSLHRKARLLGRFFEAQFRISDVYQATRRQFLDACIFGSGVIHPFHDGRGICVERVFPSELLVEHREATLGGPRQMMREMHVSRDVLRSMFITDSTSKREKARLERVIADSGPAPEQDLPYVGESSGDDVSDLVRVVEAHRLPSGPGAGDGMHIFFTNAGYLDGEKYEHDDFPYVIVRWKEHPARFWGIGLCEELVGIQTEINLMLRKIQAAYKLMAKPFILMDLNSQLPKGGLDSEIGTVVRYAGEKPEIWTPNSFHPEFYAHLDRLDYKAGELTGFTQDTGSRQEVRSQVQLSLNHDIQTERFSIVAMNFEDGIRDIAMWMVRLAKELDANGGFDTVAQKDRWSLENVPWKDIDLEDDAYSLGIRNINQLSTLFSERVNQVGNLMALGIVADPETALELIDLPDLDRHREMALAPSRNLDRIGELILDEDTLIPPEPTMDLDLGIRKMTDLFNWAQHRGVPEEKLDTIRDWLAQALHIQARFQLEQAKQAAMAAGGMGPEALPPGPAAPPAVGNDGAPPTAAPGLPQTGPQ